MHRDSGARTTVRAMEPLSVGGTVDEVRQVQRLETLVDGLVDDGVTTFIAVAMDGGGRVPSVPIPNDWAPFVTKGMKVQVRVITE